MFRVYKKIVVLALCLGIGFIGYRHLFSRTSRHFESSQVASNQKKIEDSSQKEINDQSGQEKSSTFTSSSLSQTTEMKENVAQQELSTYPDLSQYSNLRIHVDIEDQTMQILSGDQIIFSTTVSTGKADSPTPRGNFIIEQERGDFFYNAASQEGAYYWVSFKDHGIYLFHSIPTDENGNEIPEEAQALGTPVSHGCVRMTRADAKWFFENIPSDIPVLID